MYNRESIQKFVGFVQDNDGIANKAELSALVKERFGLIRDRSVYYCEDYAVRFCSSSSRRFGNTVLSLSALQKYDEKPFIITLVTSSKNYLMLANTTFLKKISHSSQQLRVNNIRGSFNGSDIMPDFEGVPNQPENFEFLFSSHENYSFSENLERLVEATNGIHPRGQRFYPTEAEHKTILDSVDRAANFLRSVDYRILNDDLNHRVAEVSSEIAIAALIGNVNLRGRIIEYLITSPKSLRDELVNALHLQSPLPTVFTVDKLGDYERQFHDYITATDIKTKILFLSSNPKGYNIDKLLAFLSQPKSVYLIYVVAINANKRLSTRLCSVFNTQLLSGTRIIKHWAGRNSRGVTQYDGLALEQIVSDFDPRIDKVAARSFVENILKT